MSVSSSEGWGSVRRVVRVVCVDANGGAGDAIAGALGAHGIGCWTYPDVEGALGACESEETDVVLVSAEVPGGLDLAERCARSGRAARVVLTATGPDASLSIEAMRRGAVDLICKPIVEQELIERVQLAAAQAEALRSQQRRLERLKRICKRLGRGRGESEEGAGGAETASGGMPELERAYKNLTGQVSTLTMASEYGQLIRQELDVESLLRSTLEFLLARLGPTNAAIFLPTGSGDYSLGAYVNHDAGRESLELVLDHLADVVPARYADEPDIVRLRHGSEVSEALGDDAAWLEGCEVVIMPCAGDRGGEPMAVVMLFRDGGSPFTEDQLPQLEALRELLAEQLERVVQVHNRAVLDETWDGFFVDTEPGVGDGPGDFGGFDDADDDGWDDQKAA